MFSMSQVAAAVGVASYRIKYALETGALKEPQRLAGRRCFQLEDVEMVRRYFGTDRQVQRTWAQTSRGKPRPT